MSANSLTTEERVLALMHLGYTEREAAFLCIAALHGGYFLRRQFCRFLDRQIGGTAAGLTEKLLAKEHATVTTACHGMKIYHLCSRPFYAALGESDNRNRRDRAPVAIKNRLIGLDFVLAHPNYRYLATEREKVDYFAGALGLPVPALPNKRYASPTTPSITVRYFVDKYPIFIGHSVRGGDPVPSFSFIDGGNADVTGFETYLQQYADLFRHLPEFHVIYIANNDRLFRSAEGAFQAFVSLLVGRRDAIVQPGTARMMEHFEARFLYENGQLESFDRTRLIRLRDERQEFSTTQYEALYERWKASGRKPLPVCSEEKRNAPAAEKGFFASYLTNEGYSFFGSLYQRDREALANRIRRQPGERKVSPELSA